MVILESEGSRICRPAAGSRLDPRRSRSRRFQYDHIYLPPWKNVDFSAEKIIYSRQCARLSSGLDMFVRHTRCNFPDGPRSKYRPLHISLADFNLDFARFCSISRHP